MAVIQKLRHDRPQTRLCRGQWTEDGDYFRLSSCRLVWYYHNRGWHGINNKECAQKKIVERAANETLIHNISIRQAKEMCQPNTTSDRLAVFTVPMKGPAPATATTTIGEHSPKKAKVIDTANLNEEDLKALKEQDPFLYYSIIQRNRSVDVMSSLRRGAGIIPRKASWCPFAQEIEFPSTTKVKRRSCISFECHVDMFLDDDCTLEGSDDDYGDSEAMFDRLLLQIRNEKNQ